MIDTSELRLDAKGEDYIWSHLRSKCLVPLAPKDMKKRNLLDGLWSDVERGRYSPLEVHGFLTSPKGKGVPRYVPVFQAVDYVLFFACAKALEEPMAAGRVENTFGGFRDGGAQRTREEGWAKSIRTSDLTAHGPDVEDVEPEEAPLDLLEYAPSSVLDPYAWVRDWIEHTEILKSVARNSPEGAVFLSFDVANFYDSIDLPRLERWIRAACAGKGASIELLMYFLTTWNKQRNLYAPTSKGLPQDTIGEFSRALANFYLVPYDREVKAEADKRMATYVRYADDMELVCRNEQDARRLLVSACEAMHRFGLNVNSSKVRMRSKAEFEFAWGFEVLDALNEDETLEKGLGLLIERYGAPGFDRRHTALKRALKRLSKPQFAGLMEERRWVRETVLADREIVVSLREDQLVALVEGGDSPADTLDRVHSISEEVGFTEPLGFLLKACRKLEKGGGSGLKPRISAIRESIRRDRDPVLSLALA